jgi:hypothetical protein
MGEKIPERESMKKRERDKTQLLMATFMAPLENAIRSDQNISYGKVIIFFSSTYCSHSPGFWEFLGSKYKKIKKIGICQL